MASALQTRLENWRLRLQTSRFGQFLNWWGAELRGLLPQALQARLSHAQGKVVLRLDDGTLDVAWFEAGSITPLENYSLEQDAGLQQQQIADLLQARELDEAHRDLLLDGGDVLTKTVTMPLATEANLRQALAFEMDRNTPFKAGDVYFDYRILERDREKAQLRAELLLAPRGIVDASLRVLAARGVPPSGVDVEQDGRPVGVNLLPLEQRHRVVNRKARMNLLLALGAVALLVAVMLQSLWLRQHQVEQVTEAIDEVRVEARRVQNIRAQIEDAAEAAGFMASRRAENPPSVAVLAEVTRIVPDDTFLDRFRAWEGNLQLQGKSDNAQQLIEVVNGSAMFGESAFRGSTRYDNRSGKEIFDLRATLELGADG
ncbi:PilN domain-containing protein [Marinihelvus fidelis]|uniref:PilN domain-containing protein n=1 Tax=Marinihelvus fidelis TaxID=2613842 RepID=A0A5N0TBQ0_9GAMM|nr:PilN domain-containing protein [Marinihelvus fidelis]KAA9130769.1 PilN domain-containing protein [Marinihelvus fidelis]